MQAHSGLCYIPSTWYQNRQGPFKTVDPPTIPVTVGVGLLGVSLLAASHRQWCGPLDQEGLQLFTGDGQKARYAILVDGFDPYYIQKNVQRIIAGVKTSVTLRTVVAQVADVVDGWIRQVSKTAVADGQLAFGDGYGRIGMKDMYLVGLRKSGSTVQILLAYDPSTVFPPLEFYA